MMSGGSHEDSATPGALHGLQEQPWAPMLFSPRHKELRWKVHKSQQEADCRRSDSQASLQASFSQLSV